MKTIKTFRITPDNEDNLKEIAKHLDRSEGWVINRALSEFVFDNVNWIKTKRPSPAKP